MHLVQGTHFSLCLDRYRATFEPHACSLGTRACLLTWEVAVLQQLEPCSQAVQVPSPGLVAALQQTTLHWKQVQHSRLATSACCQALDS